MEKSDTPKSSKSKQCKVSNDDKDKDKVRGKEEIMTSGKVVTEPSAMAGLKTSTELTLMAVGTTSLHTVESAGHGHHSIQ